MSRISTAILTISDTAFADSSKDRSGPLIKELLPQEFEVVSSGCASDDQVDIIAFAQTVVHQNIPLLITTGGTGFGPRDVTPEAISRIIEKPAPGLVHLLLSTTKFTPLAALSRPVAGVSEDTLIITLPGSPKAVRECLSVLLNGGVLQHALRLLRGDDSRALHSPLGTPAGDVNHGEKHGHQDKQCRHGHSHEAPVPRTRLTQESFAPSQRNRQSPFPLLPLEAAIDLVFKTLVSLGSELRIVDPHLVGHVLATDVVARLPIPSAPSTNVDGYALRSTDKPGLYRVLLPSVAHTNAEESKVIYRINTGAPLPPGTDAVIMVEDTRLVSTDPNNEDEESEVETLAQVDPGENVRKLGSDVKPGETVLFKGDIIKPTGGEIGTLAFVGVAQVSVIRKPKIALISTGDELQDLHQAYSKPTPNQEWGGIWDSNRPALKTALHSMGYDVIDMGIIRDNVTAHYEALHRAVHEADLVLITGGTSMGSTDLWKPVIEHKLSGTIHFGRVAVKPGKPTTFATIPVQNENKPVFILPGNPASALVTFYIFVVPALRILGGYSKESCQMPRLQVQIMEDIKLDPRPEFHRVVIKSTPQGLQAFSTGGQRSSRANSLANANGFIHCPSSSDGSKELVRLSYATAVLIGDIQWKGA